MKGLTHIILSMSTLLLILAPSAGKLINPDIGYPEIILGIVLLLIGVFIGSITPDIDKGSNSAIFHSQIPGAKGKKFILTPVFGFIINYACYKPIRFVFRIIFGKKIYAKSGHRELPHSPIGVVLISALLTLYIWLVCFALSYIPALSFLYNNVFVFVFGAAFLLGCILHLIEDTCDFAGIHYLYPFVFARVRGKLKGDGEESRPRVYALVLLAAAVVLAALSIFGVLPAQYSVIVSILAPVFLWLIFLKASGVPSKKSVRE